MFQSLLSTLGKDAPYFHAPATIDPKKKTDVFVGTYVNGSGATWALFDRSGFTEYDYSAPWYEPHCSVGVTIWNHETNEYIYVLALTENKPTWGPPPLTAEDGGWRIVQAYKKNGIEGQKIPIDGMVIFNNHVLKIINQ